MDRIGAAQKALILLLLLALALPLNGCRTRTGGGAPIPAASPAADGWTDAEQPGDTPADAAVSDALPEIGETDDRNRIETGGRTQENPDSSRKEYDENAPVEVAAGTDRLLHGEGEGNGAAFPAEDDAMEAVSQLNDQAEKTATQTVAAPEAEQMGVAEDGEQADSALTYFTVLLRERTASLYECQRVSVYWETAEDQVTIYKSSPEHALILTAGAYDVSARLLPENLRVDAGWVARKNPQVIVKIVGSEVLGGGIASASAAKAVYENLCAREGWENIDAVKNQRVLLLSQELLDKTYLQTAAALMIAKTANPDLYADVDVNQALRMLAEEAGDALAPGLYHYSVREE